MTDSTPENPSGAGFEDVSLTGADSHGVDRRHPDRAMMRPGDAAGYREAWDVLERLWQQTVDRARQLDPELLHRRVNGEWSFIETLRHLVFATDLLVKRAILHEEWEHRRYAERDLDALERQPGRSDRRLNLRLTHGAFLRHPPG